MKIGRIYLVSAYILIVFASLIILSGCSETKELSTKNVRQKFKELTGRDLPRKAESLRAIYADFRDPEIFVKFKTDSNGITEVNKTFGGSNVESRTYDANDLKYMKTVGASLFPRASIWLQEAGLKIFDQDSIQSGLKLTHMANRSGEVGYVVFIDDQQNIIYIHAYIH